MKKIIFIVLIAVIAIAYIAAGPFITIHNIKAGVEKQDSDKLSENIDFPALRSNLKEQFNALVMKNAASELQNNPFAALAMGFASQIVENMVNSFVTPSGLRSLMEGKKPKQVQGNEKLSQESNVQQPEPFKNARYTFDNLSKFSAWVKDDKGIEMRFVFQRDGLSWKLSNIIIPLSAISNTGSDDRNNNAMAKADIKNAYVAAQAFFSDKPKNIVTEEELTNYGFKPSGEDKISIFNGSLNNLQISSKHRNGRITYFIDSLGNITERQ